jgi:hypothetical protein
MEFRPTENKDLAKEIFQKRLLEIVAEFNWEVFNDIIDQFKIKSGLKIPTKEEQKKEYERRKQIHDGINEVLKRSNPESVLVSEEEMNEYRLRIPKLEINNSILAIAEADRYKTKFGTVRFNTLTASKALQEVEKKILASGHEIDFNLLDFYILKVFFHELMHLHGGVNNLYKPMNSPYNSINEAITEFLSFTVMIKYSTSVGKSLTKNMKDTYFNSSYGIYENEERGSRPTSRNIVSDYRSRAQSSYERLLPSLLQRL